MRLRQRATVSRVTAQGYDAVRAQLSPVVSGCAWFCVWGFAPGVARKVRPPPSPKGRHRASRRTRRFCRPPGPPCRRGPGPLALPPLNFVDRFGSGLLGHAHASPAFLSPSPVTRFKSGCLRRDPLLPLAVG